MKPSTKRDLAVLANDQWTPDYDEREDLERFLKNKTRKKPSKRPRRRRKSDHVPDLVEIFGGT